MPKETRDSLRVSWGFLFFVLHRIRIGDFSSLLLVRNQHAMRIRELLDNRRDRLARRTREFSRMVCLIFRRRTYRSAEDFVWTTV